MRFFPWSNLILSRPNPRYSITEWEVSEISYVGVARWLLYVCLHHEKACFLYFSRSLLISYSITLSLEKEIIVLEKSVEKVLNFGSKNLYEPNPDSTYSATKSLPSFCDASIAHYFICKLQLASRNIRTKYSTQCCKLSLKSPNCR